MKESDKIKRKIMKFLYKKYQERESNFYFKANKILIDISPRYIGKVLVELQNEEKIIYYRTTSKARMYKTKFLKR